jgi:serine protease Do/serine protease DegQ
MDQLVEFGVVRRGHLGVVVQDMTPDLARAFGIESARGAVINRVFPGSAADASGLLEGDIVIRIGDRRIDGSADLRNTVGLLQPGESVAVEFIRDGEVREITARIESAARAVLPGAEFSPLLAGASLGERDAPVADGEPRGIVVAEVEGASPAWRAGLRADDVILAVNRLPLTGFEDLQRAIGASANALLLYIRRGDSAIYIVIR